MTSKKKFCSLKVKIVVLFIVASAAAVGVYYLANYIGYNMVSDRYLSEQAQDARSSAILTEFQTYVKQNNITSTDYDRIGGWTMKNGYISVLVFQNGRAKFEAGSWGADNLEGSEYAKLYEDTATSYKFSPVIFADGIFQVAIEDYSYTKYYTLSETVSVMLGAAVIILAMLFYTGRVTNRIKRLSDSAKEIERGDLDLEVPVRSCDEIGSLATSMDNMRISVSDRIKSESEARKANSDLIAAISHDIRTPLTTLIGYLELLQEGAYTSDEQRVQYTDAAHDRAMRLKELTDQLFSYFLVYDSSQIPVKIEDFDATILLEQLLGEHIIELKDSGCRVIVNPLKTEGTIKGDVMFLKRVFDNMFSNVSKHGDLSKPVIVMAQQEADGRLHISLTNSIPRVPNRVESTKVGLKTCEKLMAAMGGEFRTAVEDDKFLSEVCVPMKKSET